MSLLDAKLQAHQFLAARYPAYPEGSPAVALDEVCSIDVFAVDLEGEVDWDLADLTGVPDLGSQASIGGNYDRLQEPCSGVNESVLLSVMDLMAFAVRGVEAMSSASILEVCNSWGIGVDIVV